MQFKTILFSTALASLQYATVNANPLPSHQLQQRADCDPVSKYSIQYFMDNKILEPPASTCLFYTAYLSGTALRFAHSGGASLTTIWDMWTCNHYNGAQQDTNPLRCIFANNADRTTYFEHMSEAMAISCDIFATVMTNFTDNIPQDGIWGRIEQPALKRTGNPGGTVDTIVAVNKTGDDLRTVWERPGTKKREVEAELQGSVESLRRRDDPPYSGCYSPEQIDDWFADVGW